MHAESKAGCSSSIFDGERRRRESIGRRDRYAEDEREHGRDTENESKRTAEEH